jgi:PD-(D/E)XK nuclease superfamily
MSRNVIDIFARGNQELFHSAFLAWLLDRHENHGLGNSFCSRIIGLLRGNSGHDPDKEYVVATEYRSGRSRFDIILRPKDPANQVKGLVLENKVKGTSKNRSYSSDATKLPAKDSVSFPFRFKTFTPTLSAIGSESDFSRFP